MTAGIRIGLCVLAGAALIAASILVVGHYEIGKVGAGSRGFTAYGVDQWTGEPLMRTVEAN